MMAMYKRGEPVIYRVTKASVKPGPRAQHVAPSPQGELYSYLIDKFWIVAEILDGDRLLLRTRRGKEHVIQQDDPNLRAARWWERMLYRNRFPVSASPVSSDDSVLRPKQRATG